MTEYCIVAHPPMFLDAKIYRWKDVEKGFERMDGSFKRTIDTNLKQLCKFDKEKSSKRFFRLSVIRDFFDIREAKFYLYSRRVAYFDTLLDKMTGEFKNKAIEGEYLKTKKLYDKNKNNYPEYFI